MHLFFIFLTHIKTVNNVFYYFRVLMFVLSMVLQRTPISHKVIEKRRRDRINRCLNELGKTVPMALAKQVCIFQKGDRKTVRIIWQWIVNRIYKLV